MSRRRWYAGQAPVSFEVEVGSESHRITWTKGRLVLHDHDVEAESVLKALGASQHQIQFIFLSEGLVLVTTSGLAGIGLGEAGVVLIRLLYPGFPAFVPAWIVVTAFISAVVTGAVFSLLPAKRAAHLDPVVALARR